MRASPSSETWAPDGGGASPAGGVRSSGLLLGNSLARVSTSGFHAVGSFGGLVGFPSEASSVGPPRAVETRYVLTAAAYRVCLTSTTSLPFSL
jgi:hypothetical protein